jgi:hypothetical protein
MKPCSFEGKWMQLEEITLSEVSQAQKVKSTCLWETVQIYAVLCKTGYTKGRSLTGDQG